MKIVTSFKALAQEKLNIVYALGTFDGIHKGHHAVIMKAVEKGQDLNAKTVVVTFDAHPFTILHPQKAPKMLCQYEDKIAILSKLGVDYMLYLPMNEELLNCSAESFLDNLLTAGIVKAIVTGDNFTFGHKGKGNPDFIRSVVEGKTIEVVDLDLMTNDTIACAVSSTQIREAIKAGKMELVTEMLGRPYSFVGKVIKGDQRGRNLGFPTLNFLFPKELTLPPDGVYVNRVNIDGKWYEGVGNVGDNPTFENQYHRTEVHIFNFDKTIYGQLVRVEFLSFLRGEIKFNSLDALIAQMEFDKKKAHEFFDSYELHEA